jgi:signal transduction histidine kinase
VTQELLTNARRHGDGPVRLALFTSEAALVIRCSNQIAAAAGEPATPGYGLLGMRERVRAVGGRLRITRSDTTFDAVVELPLTVHDEITEMVVQQ